MWYGWPHPTSFPPASESWPKQQRCFNGHKPVSPTAKGMTVGPEKTVFRDEPGCWMSRYECNYGREDYSVPCGHWITSHVEREHLLQSVWWKWSQTDRPLNMMILTAASGLTNPYVGCTLLNITISSVGVLWSAGGAGPLPVPGTRTSSRHECVGKWCSRRVQCDQSGCL